MTSSEAKLIDYIYLLEIELKKQKNNKKLKQKMRNPEDDLDDFYKEIQEVNKKIFKIHNKLHIKNLKQVFSFSQQELLISIDNLQRLKLCEYPQDEVETKVITDVSLQLSDSLFSSKYDYKLDHNTELIKSYFSNRTLVRLTVFGCAFMKVCTPESNESSSN